MITKFKIFEKTSLINIGVPYYVMQRIQRDYSISSDAKWGKLSYKKNIRLLLHKSKNNLIISICDTKIFIIYSINNEYFIETYELTENDDFGNKKWERIDRISTTITDIIKIVERGCEIYELLSGDWSPEFANVRKIKKEDSKFQEITNNFKKDFAKNFTRIIKRLYGKKSNMVSDVIIDYLKDVNKDASEQKIREILFLNVDKAKEVEEYRRKANEKDPYNLYSDNIGENSLTIFNKHLLEFENNYSDKYREYLNLPLMIEKWSRDKIFTAFAIFIFCGKLIDL